MHLRNNNGKTEESSFTLLLFIIIIYEKLNEVVMNLSSGSFYQHMPHLQKEKISLLFLRNRRREIGGLQNILSTNLIT